MQQVPKIRTGYGQESHRFLSPESSKPCVIGGLIFEDTPGLASESDGDVVFHAICNAITSLTGIPILAGIAQDLCQKDGITDSAVYLEKALETLGNQLIQHMALVIECKRPSIQSRLLELRQKIASVMKLEIDQVGVTTTSADGLTDVGCGDGVQCICLITTLQT